MKKLLTSTDIDIVEALSRVGPRNLRKVARLVGIPRETLVFRMKRMASDPRIFLRCYANVYHTNLGLKKAVVFADAVPGREKLLFESLKANGFWIFVGRSYRGREGCNAVYAIPIDHCAEFEEFIHELKSLDIAQNVQVFWSTCFQGGRITGKWFDREKEEWVFPWDEWVKEVQDAPTDLPYTLVESNEFINHADKIDIFILKELEKDAAASLSTIAAKLGISSQWAGKHFRKSIMGRGLIEGYQIFILPFENSYDVLVFVISFYNHETMARFANSLLDKPFIIMVGKLFGQNALITEVCLPRTEFRNFVDALSLLGDMKIVRDYQYLIQDLRRTSRQTISYEFFKEKKWIYDHKQHLTTLEALVNNQTYQRYSQSLKP
jgi:DNA-binding Lrp family transcriptional regulator